MAGTSIEIAGALGVGAARDKGAVAALVSARAHGGLGRAVPWRSASGRASQDGVDVR
jgi:hypothetical protein